MLKPLIFAFFTFLTITLKVAAQHEHAAHQEEAKDIKAEIKEYISHHIQDSHDFNLFEINGKHIGFPLPVILWDNGLHIFFIFKI